MKKLVYSLLIIILLIFCIAGCSSKEDILAKKSQSNVEEQAQPSLQNSDFIGKKFAVITGTMHDQVINDNLGNNELMYFNTMHDATEAVKNKKVDATVGDEPTMRKFLANNPDLIMISPPLTQEEYGMIVNKNNPELTAKLNEFYDIIKADGTYDEMIARWIDSKDISDMPDIPLPVGKGTLKIAVDALCEPFVFYNGNREIVGFDIEYARRFAKYMDMDLEVVNMDFGAIIPSVQSGKTDFGSSLITISEERAKSIDFTKPYYIGGTTIITLGTSVAVKMNFIDSFKNSFYQNFIVENRYHMLLSGLWITIAISVLALILGTIMGFFICFLSMSKYKVLNWISKIYITILRGTPMVVLLMITYYIVFAKVNINPIIVAVIAFSLSGGAFISQIIRSSILTVDQGQIEAARSMGFSSAGTFFIITLPQATRVALPLYKSEFIGMMKQTAIVGYIAIVDLTKVGDIIRSRTYDAFFPLIAVAVIYLIAIGLFILIFNTIYELTDKRHAANPKIRRACR
jgi:polar amino acid transport system substrate-binding protein